MSSLVITSNASTVVDVPIPDMGITIPQAGGSVTISDLWGNLHYGGNVNEQHPDLVAKYTESLQEEWEQHQVLRQRFTRSGELALTPEQLRTLRSLGYIR